MVVIIFDMTKQFSKMCLKYITTNLTFSHNWIYITVSMLSQAQGQLQFQGNQKATPVCHKSWL